MDFRLQSPYCNNFKIPSQQKGKKRFFLNNQKYVFKN